VHDYLAAIVYSATTGALTFLAACTGWQWMRNKFRGGVLNVEDLYEA